MAPFIGLKEFGDNYHKIFKELELAEYVHVDDEIMRVPHDEFMKYMNKGKQSYVEYNKRKLQAIQESDICVFEASFHALGVGFLIQRALDNAKPTIVLYYKKNVPMFLSGLTDEKLIIREYGDKDLRKVLKESLELARERRDKRFNFFLSPKLLEYLEDASTKEGVTKSKLIRDMIVNHMRKKDAEKQ